MIDYNHHGTRGENDRLLAKVSSVQLSSVKTSTKSLLSLGGHVVTCGQRALAHMPTDCSAHTVHPPMSIYRDEPDAPRF